MTVDATERDRSSGWEPDRPVAPPYVSYSTFRTLLEWLRTEEVPLRFDRSFWQAKFSGSNGTQVVAALRFLGLLAADKPQPVLERLVQAMPDERRQVMRELLPDSYTAVPFAELSRATPAMVRSWFRAYPIDGHTLRKAISFFVNAAKDADIPLSNAVRKMAKSRSSGAAAGSAREKQPAADDWPVATNQSPDLIATRRQAGAMGPSGPHQSHRTIALESGGTVTVGLDVDLFRLSGRDRDFVLSLVEIARSYEEKRDARPPANGESSARGDHRPAKDFD